METMNKDNIIDVIHVATLMEDKASIQRPYQFLKTNSLKKLLLERI
jgi:UDP-glucose 4-epimerase